MKLPLCGLAVALVAFVLLGCGPKNGARSLGSKPLPTPREVARQVARLRGLPDRRPAPIEFVDESRFLRELELPAAQPSRKSAFTAKSVGLREVLGEQIVGYYDKRSHRIRIRAGRKWDDDMVNVLAHELTHSLQAQHLPLPKTPATNLDEHLARKSLIEGDAMLVMLAYASLRQRVPLKRALARAAIMVSDIGFERYLRASGGNDVLASAPPAVRQRVTFPYAGGLTFVGDLWRTGGFGLVNRVYDAPPTSTEHVLHPEKYLAGEGVVPVKTPPAPPAAQEVIQGRLGELGTRVLLAESVPQPQAAAAAAGWGGDAFIVYRVGTTNAMQWVTTWDSERDAQEFHLAARKYAVSVGGDFSEGGRTLLRRRGKHVVFADGIADREALSERMLELIGTAPQARPPFGNLTIPKLKRPPRTRPPYVTRTGLYVNEYLGLVAQAPAGVRVKLISPTSAVFTLEGETTAFGGIELSEQIAGRDTIDDVHGTFRDIVAEALGRYKLEYTGGREIYLGSLGHAVERNWRVKGTRAGLSVIVLPICGRNGSFVLWRFHADYVGRAVFHQWLKSIRPTAWKTPPVCAVLDP